MAEVRNAMPLPAVKPLCGLRLPPDRYCLSSCNYKLRAIHQPKKMTKSALEGGAGGGRSGQRNSSKQSHGAASNSGSGNIQHQQIPRQTVASNKTQIVTIPKPVIKFTTNSKPITSPPGLVNSTVPMLSLQTANTPNLHVPEVKMEVELPSTATNNALVSEGIEIKTEHRIDEDFNI